MCLAAFEQAVPRWPLTAEIMRPRGYPYTSRGFSMGKIVRMCVCVCPSMKLEASARCCVGPQSQHLKGAVLLEHLSFVAGFIILPKEATAIRTTLYHEGVPVVWGYS